MTSSLAYIQNELRARRTWRSMAVVDFRL